MLMPSRFHPAAQIAFMVLAVFAAAAVAFHHEGLRSEAAPEQPLLSPPAPRPPAATGADPAEPARERTYQRDYWRDYGVG
jgi:hypothetical protein